MAKKKSPKHVANEAYLIQAAKMVVYPCDIYDKTIDVPEKELEIAQEDLSVKHLLGLGFRITSCIGEVIKKDVFDPKLTSRIVSDEVESRYKVGDQFGLIVGFKQVEIIKIKNGKLEYKSIGQVMRKDGVMKAEDLDRAIKNKQARKLN